MKNSPCKTQDKPYSISWKTKEENHHWLTNGPNFLNFVVVDIPDYCKAHPSEFLPDPDNCAKFFNCSESLSKPRTSRSTVTIGKYGYECPYPELYDTMLKMCSNFTQVRCTTRWEPMAPCKSLAIISVTGLEFGSSIEQENSYEFLWNLECTKFNLHHEVIAFSSPKLTAQANFLLNIFPTFCELFTFSTFSLKPLHCFQPSLPQYILW